MGKKREAKERPITEEASRKKSKQKHDSFFHREASNTTPPPPLPVGSELSLPLPIFSEDPHDEARKAGHSPRNIPSHVKQSPLIAHFKKGDLVYGLKNSRRPYTTYLDHKMLQPENTIENFFNNAYFIDDNLKEFEKKAALTPEQEHYQDFLFAHLRYHPNRPGGKGKDDEPKIRRSCKAAIEYVLRQGGTIHFVLDHINMDRVVNKEYEHPAKKEDCTKLKDYSFTASELRYIYRHQHLLKHLKGHIVFYNGGAVCEAPWESHPTPWEEALGKTIKEVPTLSP